MDKDGSLGHGTQIQIGRNTLHTGNDFDFVIGVQPPSDKALKITIAFFILTAIVWFGFERRRFKGPPQGVMIQQRAKEIEKPNARSARSNVNMPGRLQGKTALDFRRRGRLRRRGFAVVC